MRLAASIDGWQFVTVRHGVKVMKRFLGAGPFVSDKDSQRGEKHICVKSFGLIDAPPEAVFQMFIDKSRVKEYNEHIVEMDDRKTFPVVSNPISGLKHWTKLTWTSTPSYGPFKPRDFFSVVHYRSYRDGSYVIVNRPAYHSSDKALSEGSKKKSGNQKYVRATILLAGNIIKPVKGDKNKSYLTMIAHVNPGGGADTRTGAFFANKFCAAAPPTFIRKLEAAAKKI